MEKAPQKIFQFQPHTGTGTTVCDEPHETHKKQHSLSGIQAGGNTVMGLRSLSWLPMGLLNPPMKGLHPNQGKILHGA